jgi:hypothetical protein
MTVHKNVAFSDLTIDRQELYLLMGYGDRIPDQPFLDMIDVMLDELAGCCTPEYGYVVCPGKRLDNAHLQVAETVLQPGRIITSSLREATSFAVFVATVGQGFDRWNRAKKPEDDMVRAFFADSLGSVLAEACVGVMLARMEHDMAEQGLFVSNSYSPGYCDWLLEEQRKLFSFFPEQFCGVTLTESCLMLPIKSVSGIIGIGENVKKRLYSCEVCTMTNCVKNRKKTTNNTDQ